MLLRALRRAGVSLVYSQGFSPRPKVGFGPALPLGLTSEAEYLDFDSYVRLDAETTTAGINDVLPVGVRSAGLDRF